MIQKIGNKQFIEKIVKIQGMSGTTVKIRKLTGEAVENREWKRTIV